MRSPFRVERPRIGFIAMSGVRAQNKELMERGLTLPGFVERSKVIASLPSLSLLTLAALTPPRFEVEYREIADLKLLPELPLHYDLVAITSLSAQIHDAYEVARHYREHGIPVAMGGLHVTSLPDEAMRHADVVVVGEGEPVWPRVLQDFERGKLRPVYSAENQGGFDLSEAPVPRFDLLDPTKYNRITVQTSRGCPHKCVFCASSILLTSKYKLKPVEKVIEEIRAIKAIWPNPFIEFADDNSFVHREHYKKLLRALAEEEVRWFTETDVNVAWDEELLGLMRDSGCEQILIGLESPGRAGLDGLEDRTNWKLKQQEWYKVAIERIQSHGITVNGCFILGLDGHGPDVFENVFEFVRESGLYEVQITFLTPFPGTPLYRQLHAEGRLIRENAWEMCTLFDINYVPRGMSVEQLHEGFLWLAEKLYNQEETARRRRRFFKSLKRSENFRARCSSAEVPAAQLVA